MPDLNPHTENASAPVLEIAHLKKAFAGKEVLKDVNLALAKGENLVVMGKSGTGKSVLIKCIVGLIQPDAGEIKVFGESTKGLKHSALDLLRVKIGFLFQGAALYDSMTVRENLEFPLKAHPEKISGKDIEDMVKEALEDVKLGKSIDAMPSDLSGGMRKRIGLARTLILRPEIMLYDEPTTGLDPITSKEISELMVKMQEKYKVSSVIITHDVECAGITANRVVLLNEGTLAAEGSFEEMKNSKEPWIRAFFNA